METTDPAQGKIVWALSLTLPPLPSIPATYHNVTLQCLVSISNSILYHQHYSPSSSGVTPCIIVDNKLSYNHHTIDAHKRCQQTHQET